jgi:hypothetical protein
VCGNSARTDLCGGASREASLPRTTQARATPITPRGDLRVRLSWQMTTRGEGEPDKAVFLENWAFVSPVVFAHYHA